jgi:hypothetical protein
VNPLRSYECRFNNQLKPKLSLICFLKNDTHFRDEFNLRPSSTGRTIICRDGRSAAHELIRDGARF